VSDHRFIDPFAYDPAIKSIGKLMGETVPSNVLRIDIWDQPGKIVWFTRGGRHEMDFPHDDIMPVIVAMRMSC